MRILSEDNSPIGSAEELQLAPDETVERLRGITEELVTLETVAREVVNAWQGQGTWPWPGWSAAYSRKLLELDLIEQSLRA